MVNKRPPKPKLIMQGTFNTYQIGKYAYTYDHIAKKFRRNPSKDYLIKKK